MGNNAGNVCNDFYSSYPASEYLPGVFGNVGIGGMIIGVVYFCSSAVTIAWIRKQKQNALMGMEGAAKHVVFPIYLPIMWVSALSDAFVGLVIFFVKKSTTGSTIWPNAIITATALGIQHVVIEGLAVILMQYGCGMRAMRVAGMAGGSIGIATFLTVLFYYRNGSSTELSVMIYFCWMLCLLIFYSILWLMPLKRLYRRPAVIFYAKFWTLFQLLVIVAELLGAFGPGLVPESTTVATCMYNAVALPVFVVFKPFIMYSTLLMESKWWQGLLLIRPHCERASASSRGSHGAGSKRHGHPIRYIRSIDGPLDELASRQSAGSLHPDLSLGTSGSDTRDSSDIYSGTEAGYSKSILSSFLGLVKDAMCYIGVLGKDKSASWSQYSDSNNSSASGTRGTAGPGGAPQLPRDEEAGGDEAGADEALLRNSDLSGDGAVRLSEGSSVGTVSERDSGSSNRRDTAGCKPGSRGKDKRAGAGSFLGSLSQMFSFRRRNQYDQLKGPLLGVEVGFSEAQELAQEVDNITHEGTVKLLNFAYLSLEKQGRKMLGVGSFSKVYAGRYRNHPVAVKMLFTQDLNPDVIKRCSNEARILTEISPHPNVVHVYGVAVLPPSVCLVLEICEYGSLADVLRGPNDGSSVKARPPLNLCYSDRMYLALGCAKGLQALHAFSPLLCHRDIKSFNFLIDSQLNAKIADLDLGHQYDEDTLQPLSSVGDGDSDLGSSPGSKGGGGKAMPVKVGGSNMCIYWQAPEVLLGQQYTQKSDIHSLALVIWEIISAGKVVKFYTGGGRESSVHSSIAGGLRMRGVSDISQSAGQVNSAVSYGAVPYAECKNMAEVREKIIRGHRPLIPSAVGTPGSVKSLTGGLTRPPDPVLLDLLQLGWHPEPHMRPDVDFMVEGLTRCWRNSLHTTIVETPFLVDLAKIEEENFKLTVLQDYSSASKGFRGSNITMASSFLGAATMSSASSHHAHLQQLQADSSGTASLSRAKAQQRVVRKPPSPEVIASLLLMKSEARWSKLEDEGAYLVLTPLRPFYMLWATRKWTQLTGFLVNDVIAYDICTLLGPKADHFAFEECLETVGAYGRTEHIMTTIYRRDGKPLQLSVHMFPVFDSSPGSTDGANGSHPATGESSYSAARTGEANAAAAADVIQGTPEQNLPGRVSFSRCAPSELPVSSNVPVNSNSTTPQRSTLASKAQGYRAGGGGNLAGSAVNQIAVHSPMVAPQASALSQQATPLSPLRRTTSLTPQVSPTPYSVSGIGNTHTPMRSVSNVYSVSSSGQMTNKVAGSVGSFTPQVTRSRATSAAGSTTEDEDLTPLHWNGSAMDGAPAFESLIEDECAHRRVAYIAVQFSCIKDVSS